MAKPPRTVTLVYVWTEIVQGLIRHDKEPGVTDWPVPREDWEEMWQRRAKSLGRDEVTKRWIAERTRQMEDLGLVEREDDNSRVVIQAPDDLFPSTRGWVPVREIPAEELEDMVLRDGEGEPMDAIPRKVWNDLLRLVMDDPSDRTLQRTTRDLEKAEVIQRHQGGNFVQLTGQVGHIFDGLAED